MRPKLTLQGAIILAGFLQLALGLGSVRPAWAERNGVAMFHDGLAPYGNWVDYGKYGPVWYPTKVSSSWRPYLDGRWTPSHEGWAFETSEPWGWATYHYGNWMPTTEYGWVWSPGSTWYPSTAAWRTSDDYVGWAPVPPPDYVPEPAFYPDGGYNPEAPVLDQLAAPLWIFARAAEFLLGFGQPYGPAYSYYNSFDSLAPFSYAPIVYGGTFPLTDFYYPGYAPAAYYCFGPPFPYACRISNVNVAEFNTFVNNNNFTRIRNGLPPALVAQRFPFISESIPSAVRGGRGFGITRAADVARAEHELNRPGVIAPPSNLPALSKAIPKASPALGGRTVGPEGLGGIKGMSLPRQAQRPLTPTMRRQISLQRQMGLPQRIETRPEFRPLGRPGAAAPVPGAAPGGPSREIQPAPGKAIQAAPRPASPEVIRGTSREPHPPTAGAFRPAPSRGVSPPAAMVGRAAPSRQFSMPSGYRPSMPREFRAAPPPVARAPRPAPAPRAASPAPRGSAPAPGSPPPQHPQHR